MLQKFDVRVEDARVFAVYFIRKSCAINHLSEPATYKVTATWVSSQQQCSDEYVDSLIVLGRQQQHRITRDQRFDRRRAHSNGLKACFPGFFFILGASQG